MMKCSISGCSNTYNRKGQTKSFFGFPNIPKILTAWVAATGTPNFIPTHNSKICSIHFDESSYVYLGLKKSLKAKAVPTKFLPEDAKRRISEYLKKEDENNPMSCILGKSAAMKDVAVVRDNVPPQAKSIVLLTPSQPPPANPSPHSTIKVVDMKKLLQPQPSEPPASSSAPKSLIDRTGVTASQVLTCLRKILPCKFDFSRMIPDEKVASLVIRYLKLDDKDVSNQIVVKEHLKIIIDSAKVKDKKSFDFSKHPYSKISDRDLKRALSVILPNDFSMSDITNDLLALICVTLKMDIHTDAYYILIRKIRKFTSEGKKFTEILNRGNKPNNISLEIEEGKEELEGDVKVKDDKSEIVFVDVNDPVETSKELFDEKPAKVNGLNSTPKSSLNSNESESELSSSTADENDVSKPSKIKKRPRDIDWEPEIKTVVKPKAPSQSRPQPNTVKLHAVVIYLHEKKCSAKDVLTDYRRLFDLSRHIQMRLEKTNVRNLKSKLKYIIKNKLNINNINEHFKKLRSIQQAKTLKPPSSRVRKIYGDKLKMKPVVVLQDMLNYDLDQLLFMRRSKVKSYESSKQVSFSLRHNPSDQRYTTEHVKKLTDESYKEFRKIVLKRNGTKGIFRLKYAKLDPGTVVYAKNYRQPGVGWAKGVVYKSEGPLMYKVKLDDKSLWCCTVDQLRPILSKVSNVLERQRNHRLIKPKQLFDL